MYKPYKETGEYMEHLSQNIRVAIDKDNPSVERIEDRCIKCGQCARVCNEFVEIKII